MFATSNLFGLSDINVICLCIDQARQATCTNSYTFSSLSQRVLYSRHDYQQVTPCQRSVIEGNLGPDRLRKSDHATDIDWTITTKAGRHYDKMTLLVESISTSSNFIFSDIWNIRLLDCNYYAWQFLPLHRCDFRWGLGGQSVKCIFWYKVDSDEWNLKLGGALQHFGVCDCIWQLQHDHAQRQDIVIIKIFVITLTMKI